MCQLSMNDFLYEEKSMSYSMYEGVQTDFRFITNYLHVSNPDVQFYLPLPTLENTCGL